MSLTHLDEDGAARMVDVGGKEVTRRRAVAGGRVLMSAEALRLVREGGPKGDVLQVARIAGIQAAKKTAELIPLCHVIPLDAVNIEVEFDDATSRVIFKATASARWTTGLRSSWARSISTLLVLTALETTTTLASSTRPPS